MCYVGLEFIRRWGLACRDYIRMITFPYSLLTTRSPFSSSVGYAL